MVYSMYSRIQQKHPEPRLLRVWGQYVRGDGSNWVSRRQRARRCTQVLIPKGFESVILITEIVSHQGVEMVLNLKPTASTKTTALVDETLFSNHPLQITLKQTSGRVGAPQVLGQEVHAEGGDGHRLGGGRKLRRHGGLVREAVSLLAASGIDRAHGVGRLSPSL